MHFFFRNPGSPSTHVSLPQHHQQTFQGDQWASPSRGWEWRRRDSRASQQPQPFNGGTAMVSWFRCYSHHSCKKQKQQHKLTFPTIIGKRWMSKNQNTMGARMWRSPAKTHACCRSFIDLGWRIVKDGWKGIDFWVLSILFFNSFFKTLAGMIVNPLSPACLMESKIAALRHSKTNMKWPRTWEQRCILGSALCFNWGQTVVFEPPSYVKKCVRDL